MALLRLYSFWAAVCTRTSFFDRTRAVRPSNCSLVSPAGSFTRAS